MRRHGVPVLLLVAGAVLWVLDPPSWHGLRQWLQLPTLAGLVALLACAQAVRDSGVVQQLAARLAGRMHTQRSLAGLLLCVAAALAMVLTNDVALFLIVPLTLALCDRLHLPRQRLVIFEALAVNAGSALSPIGNPQNLLLWQHSDLSIWAFAADMALPVLLMGTVLGAMAWLGFSGTGLRDRGKDSRERPVDRRFALGAVLLLLVVVTLLEMGLAVIAAAIVLIVLAVLRPAVLRAMDWSLVVTIGLMFLLLGQLASNSRVAQVLDVPNWHQVHAVLLGGALLSQLISNVPATVALIDRVPDTMQLAAAVNIGGAGLVTGSLANLIALRLEGSRRIWWQFHLWSLPYLVIVMLVAVCLMS